MDQNMLAAWATSSTYSPPTRSSSAGTGQGGKCKSSVIAAALNGHDRRWRKHPQLADHHEPIRLVRQ
jgi:hypothetical protein